MLARPAFAQHCGRHIVGALGYPLQSAWANGTRHHRQMVCIALPAKKSRSASSGVEIGVVVCSAVHVVSSVGTGFTTYPPGSTASAVIAPQF
jgi:hypothetical protein